MADKTNDDAATSAAEKEAAEKAAAQKAAAEKAAAEKKAAAAKACEELELTIGKDGKVGLEMLTGLSGPTISLSKGDPHSCDPAEAVRLVRAGFAKAR
jgi:hypothetical protein